MKSKLIEITVSGRTGTGKSEVLELIANALTEFDPAINITGHVCTGAAEEAQTTKQTIKHQNKIVVVLYEQNVSGEIKLHD
jgi:nucleoside-triphosphatase THEP1